MASNEKIETTEYDIPVRDIGKPCDRPRGTAMDAGNMAIRMSANNDGRPIYIISTYLRIIVGWNKELIAYGQPYTEVTAKMHGNIYKATFEHHTLSFE